MTLALAHGLSFDQLHTRDGLARVDACFVDALTQREPALAAHLVDARSRTLAGDPLPPRDEAELLIALGPALDAFVARLFGIEAEWAELHTAHAALAPLLRAKWKFVKRQAQVRVAPESVAEFDPVPARAQLSAWIGVRLDDDAFDELAFARAVLDWQARVADKAAAAAVRDTARERVALALRYSAWAVHTEAGRLRHEHGVLFRLPGPVDALAPPSHVVAAVAAPGITVHRIDVSRLRRREGFDLTEPHPTLARALDETHYCLICHAQGTDSCSKGLRDKDSQAGDGGPVLRRSTTGALLAGCPLDERISEFHALKKAGLPIAALAMIAIDNPMLPATGHRICNDCMKACIYQSQTPVDIPRAETRTLEDVLALPWGVEIYALLTRWNPLDLRRPLPCPPSGRTVLVAGMGPAGFTLAHHLLNDGHAVVGIDGLKIEPLPVGLADEGFAPIEDVESLRAPLSIRAPGGFGGVAEYGITVRWDKNYLTLIRLLLERRASFALYGGVRLGGTLTLDDAFALGVDHVALAMGAGRPTVPELPGGLARGVRTASDFLMALQSTGAAQADSLAAMQLRLPVLVIGGGLTAVDTATEALAYYPLQVERFLARHEVLVAREGEAAVRARWRGDERDTADEFLAHARALRAERAAAAAQGRPARTLELLQGWGGVTIAYRRALVDSPACRLNPEELEKALEEGIAFAEHLAPRRFEVDADGAVRAAVFARGDAQDGAEVMLPARSVLVAAGTRPNTVLAREFPDALALDGEHFRAIDADGRPVTVTPGLAKPAQTSVLTALRDDGRGVSFFGDLHPAWSGNVVKAMGSAKRGYPVVSALLARHAPADTGGFASIVARLDDGLQARVERVVRLAPTIVEVVVRAPFAARRFAPGQFYRLQDFDRDARRVVVDGVPTRLAMEGLALTGAWVDREAGLVGTVVLEMGGSSNLCADLAPGQPVVLMGPTGTATEIPQGRAVVLVGGGLGNAVLFSIGAACRAAGSKVLYFAGYRRAVDRFHVEAIEAAADCVVWCCDEAPRFVPGRPQDRAFAGNVVDAMRAWADGALGVLPVTPASIEHLLAIGSDRMMAAVAAARHGPLAGRLNPAHRAIGSINSPMQCMLKEICGQCLQRQVDPSTGVARYVFSCFEQDQPLDAVDFAGLDQRLRQNGLQEAQAAAWLKVCRAGAWQSADAGTRGVDPAGVGPAGAGRHVGA